jgi:hypothetical protein
MEPEPECRCLEISADTQTIIEIPDLRIVREPRNWEWIRKGDLPNILNQLEEAGWHVRTRGRERDALRITVCRKTQVV